MLTAYLPSVSLTPRAMLYIAIGWAAVALFFVWMPLVVVYGAVLILWHLGRLVTGGFLRAGEMLGDGPPSEKPAGERKDVDGQQTERGT